MRGLVVALCLLCLAGCGVESGVVVDKRHEPARSYWTTSTGCNQGGCVTVPVQAFDDEDWELRLRSGDDEGWVRVTEAQYEAHGKGDMFGGASDDA